MKHPELHDSLYWVNRPMDSEKDWIDDQPNWLESYVHSTYHPHRQMVVDEVKKLYPVSRVLEIGCNTGSNLLRINEIFPKVKLFGIDVNEQCVKRAKKFLENALIKTGTYYAIPFPDKFFDIVLADAVLMYASPKDIMRAMAEVDRVARRAIIIVDRYKFSKKGLRNGHIWARNYEAILEDLGYKVETTKITKEQWPHSIGWQKYGRLFVGVK